MLNTYLVSKSLFFYNIESLYKMPEHEVIIQKTLSKV